MSIEKIRAELEEYLKNNVNDIVIKWSGTNSYFKNGVYLTQSEIDALDTFIEPRVIPISQNRVLMSSSNPRRFDAFFQISIYTRENIGDSEVFNIASYLDGIFIEKTVNYVYVESSKIIGSFISGDFKITPLRYFSYVWG